MSQATQSKGTQGQTGGPRGKRAPVYGRGPPGGSKDDRPRRPRREPVEEVWVPKTDLGKKVAAGEITSLEEIIESGLRIQEAGIIKKLLPDLKSEVVDVGIIQKMTANGQSTRFKAIVAAILCVYLLVPVYRIASFAPLPSAFLPAKYPVRYAAGTLFLEPFHPF